MRMQLQVDGKRDGEAMFVTLSLAQDGPLVGLVVNVPSVNRRSAVEFTVDADDLVKAIAHLHHARVTVPEAAVEEGLDADGQIKGQTAIPVPQA